MKITPILQPIKKSKLASPHTCDNRRTGFALIAALGIMGFLVLLAVSMFTLASINIAISNQSIAQTKAQANAKMAMMIAIGELQKEMGPDRAVTATSEIRGTASTPAAKPHTTGVWESWNFLDSSNSSPSINYGAEKTARFKKWLVSTANEIDPTALNFVDNAWTEETVELIGSGTLGPAAPDTEKVSAGLVPISMTGNNQGSYAWHVSDESTKARINLYRDPSQNTTLAQKRALNTGHLPDASVIEAPDGSLLNFLPTDATPSDYNEAQATMAKVTDLEQAELLDQAQGKLKPLRNDITFHSLGVLADARNGGLKSDLSSVFEMGTATANTLPDVFTDRTLYESTLGIARGSTPYASDPNWSALAAYYNSFRNLTAPDTDPTIALKPSVDPRTEVPTDFNPAPVIVRVDTIFSLVARPLDNMADWISNPAGPQVQAWDYLLNLIYTPVVVLHNPYNVSVSFYRMDVTFENVPVAFNFMFQPGEAGSTFVSRSVVEGDFENLNTMLGNTETPDNPDIGRGNKRFGMSIADWSDALSLPNNDSIAGPIVLKPGQTLICGPVFPANSNYDQDTKSGSNTIAFDWQWDNTEDSTEITNVIKSNPVNVQEYGYIPGLGFEINSITIASKRKERNANLPDIDTGVLKPNGRDNYIWKAGAYDAQAAMPLRDAGAAVAIPSDVTDRFYVEYKVQQPEYYVDNSTTTQTQLSPEFTVTAQIQATESDSLVDFATLGFNYQNDDTLQDILEDRVYRYPPEQNDYLTGSEVAAPSGVLYSEQGPYVRPFAVFSALTRTTRGGVYETGQRTSSGSSSSGSNLLKDGRLAGKPFLFHNPSLSNFTLDLTNDKLGLYAYELNFQPFKDNTDYFNYMDIDVNRVPALSGNQSSSGVKSGSYFEVPSGPMQTIADFSRSNAFTTSYLPHFLQPVSNSSLHPLMSADSVIETDSSISSDPLLDHSFLANHALYDRFYFSTFATRGSETPEAVFEEFMNGTSPLMSQAFLPYLPMGQTLATAKDELYEGSGRPGDQAFAIAAEYQMIRGPFNVNSTSVEAWKAVLAASNQNEITTLLTNPDASGTSLVTSLETSAATGIPITAMSLPNGEAIPNAGYSADMATGWNGYRELSTPELVASDSDIERLAVKIVEEVRLRGPFLSMSEFVNRRIGPSGPLTLSGALEAAIAKAEINEVEDATSSNSFLGQVPITTADISDTGVYSYKTPEASIGNPAAGAPGWVSQADLLDILGPGATVRGDTFVIRVYGDTQDTSGKVEARAYGEAVVQRVPDYVDPGDRPSAPATKLANQNFGRRFEVVSFRWLSQNEI